MKYFSVVSLLACSLLLGQFLAAETIILNPQADATLYEPITGSEEPTASGKGEAVFAGRIGTSSTATEGAVLRRFLTKFDFSSIPQGATITSAELTYVFILNRERSTTHENTLHRVTKDWNEGPAEPFGNGGAGIAATPTDATWERTGIADETWANTGGDFTPASSAVGIAPRLLNESMTFSSQGMVNDIQAWVNGTVPNYGWIVLGDESGPAQTARGFGSREVAFSGNTPTLTVTYTTNNSTDPDIWVVY
ncbi:MAG: DNRLRE domain-containing protein [Sumerlaeia bacterium]